MHSPSALIVFQEICLVLLLKRTLSRKIHPAHRVSFITETSFDLSFVYIIFYAITSVNTFICLLGQAVTNSDEEADDVPIMSSQGFSEKLRTLAAAKNSQPISPRTSGMFNTVYIIETLSRNFFSFEQYH